MNKIIFLVLAFLLGCTLKGCYIKEKYIADDRGNSAYQCDNYERQKLYKNNYISIQEAKEIMQDKFPNAMIFDFDLENGIYEGELKEKNIEHEIYVDALTGRIIWFGSEIN